MLQAVLVDSGAGFASLMYLVHPTEEYQLQCGASGREVRGKGLRQTADVAGALHINWGAMFRGRMTLFHIVSLLWIPKAVHK